MGAFIRIVLLIFVVTGAIAAIALNVWRQLDHRADRVEMDRLLATQPSTPSQFTTDMVASLPEPAVGTSTSRLLKGHRFLPSLTRTVFA